MREERIKAWRRVVGYWARGDERGWLEGVNRGSAKSM